jgi:hypothetical protein
VQLPLTDAGPAMVKQHGLPVAPLRPDLHHDRPHQPPLPGARTGESTPSSLATNSSASSSSASPMTGPLSCRHCPSTSLTESATVPLPDALRSRCRCSIFYGVQLRSDAAGTFCGVAAWSATRWPPPRS